MHTYDSGTFIVGSTGEVEVDYLFDGGWFRGELALFSLDSMEEFTPGSEEFMLEAARRALTNSDQGRVVVRDEIEGARFDADLPWERNFNIDPEQYLGAQTYNLTPGDEVGVMLVQNTTVQETYNNLENITQFGKLPLFSIPEANLSGASEGQFNFVDINGTGTIGLEDIPAIGSGGDYNDMILQFVGLDGNFASLEDNIDPDRDWSITETGKQLMEYADSRVSNDSLFNSGVFEVGESGEVTVDFLYDGGAKEGEVGIFSLSGMNPEDIGSETFAEEAISRAQSNSTEGYVIVSDSEEGARFETDTDGEPNFNTGEYQGTETFQMEPGDQFGLISIPNGTFEVDLNADGSIPSQDPLLSISQANENDQSQFATIEASNEGVTVGLEDQDPNSSSDRDYNDIVISFEGIAEPIGVGLPAVEDVALIGDNSLEVLVGTEDVLTLF